MGKKMTVDKGIRKEKKIEKRKMTRMLKYIQIQSTLSQ